MGANALGKTTMMKMITGVDKPDSGSISKKIKIAYKPQYLQNDIDGDVISLLDKANDNPVEESMEEEQILDPLKIKKLYNKSIRNLSGGELQKVAVASCLLQKVDVYALDEPSAFLDVEDRIAVAKFLQKFVRSFGKSAIVIDHDLQLMDLVSDSMVIFEGESGVSGKATSPMSKANAMNRFLKSLDMSFRRDERSLRPRVNKLESRLDKNQKTSGNYYYKN
jgi:ATP-binding cassette subfamily E protein 1